MRRAEHPAQRNRLADRESRRRAFAAQLYREELGRHWRPRGLSRGDRLQIARRYTRIWDTG
jgi:hypothetical protein